MLPGALAFEGRSVLGAAGVLDRRLGVDEDAGQFVLAIARCFVETPEPGLRLESRHARVFHSVAGLLHVHEGRYPLAGSDAQTPAIEVKVQRRVGVKAEAGAWLSGRVGAVEAHDAVVFVLHPDAPEKLPRNALVDRSDIEHQAADLAQELPPNVVEIVGAAIEIRG